MYIMYFIHIQPLPNLFFISTPQRSPSSSPVVFPLTFLSFMYLNVGLIYERKRDIYFFWIWYICLHDTFNFIFLYDGRQPFFLCVPVLTHACMYTSITFTLSFHLSMVIYSIWLYGMSIINSKAKLMGTLVSLLHTALHTFHQVSS